MGFIAKNSGGGDFKKVPAGAFIARCYSIIDLGTQTQNGQFGESTAHKLRLGFEVFGEDEDGSPLTVSFKGETKPMTIDKEYTVSMHEKANLRKELSAWRGKPFTDDEAKAFDVSALLGQYCMLNVAHKAAGNGKVYANIAGITPVPGALKNAKPQGVHALVKFDIDQPNMIMFEALPEFLQNKIKSAPEWDRNSRQPELSTANAADDISDDDIPF